MERFIIKDQKKLRFGHTTGSCAAAAAKAAAHILYSGVISESVTIDTPKGWELKLAVEDVHVSVETPNGKTVRCAVRKDAGDDPDVTNGILIYAAVSANNSGDIIITGGKGVGLVTKKGLD
ncbi:MAG: cobalt-precorrin-5B (C(1))-methyltransferase, partial [Eubacteriaceae bacterium]|nr:cobalt-precorrin-5B (C(1))-methyltransferase [Eubacteriaceae bacterium]